MSGLKPIVLTEFYRLFHARTRRPRTVAQLAARIYSSRAHVTEVLNGNRTGGQTWRKLARVLTEAELALLGRDKGGAPLPTPIVPRETLSHVEHTTQVPAA